MNFTTFIFLLHGVLLKYGINANPESVFDHMGFLQLVDEKLGEKLPVAVKVEDDKKE